MRKVTLVVLIALLVLGVELASTYRGWYMPPPAREPALGRLALPQYPLPSAPSALPTKRSGLLLLDTLHFNFFLEGELEPFLSSVARRGYRVDFFGDRLAFQFLSPSQREAALEEGLRRADSYVVILPLQEFKEGEVKLVQDFVGRGGKVLLVADPTRFHQINSLATSFGINFESDYLYNTQEHEANYRNVFFRQFADDPLTQGLGTVVLYTAGSISGAGELLLLADAATRSDRRGPQELLAPAVKLPGGQAIAIADFTFLTAPYNAVADNQGLIDNLADFLTTSTRRFTLTDFPFFLRKERDVFLLSRQALSEASHIKQLVSAPEQEASLVEVERPQVDTIFVGLYEDLDRVRATLRSGGLDFDSDVIRTPFTPSLPSGGSGVLYLDIRDGRHVLVVLADTLLNLNRLVGRLEIGTFREGLVSPNVGLYRLP